MQQVARYAQNRELRIEINYSCNKLHATRKDSIRIAYVFYNQTLAGDNQKISIEEMLTYYIFTLEKVFQV